MMQTNTRPARVEVLAPAGDEAMLRAAVYAGADAVYLGLSRFSARATAGNFTTAALREAVAFCHARNVKVHVAVNTMLLPDEESAVAATLSEAEAAGADAVIVQDLATAALAARFAPHLALHGSTQMSVHSLAGAQMLAQLGFARVILSRECSLAEIEHIAAHCGIETEVFVHGALCMSVSGQCYMSAFLGGRSGNRGACAGPCRLPFSVCESGSVPAAKTTHGVLLEENSAPSAPDGTGASDTFHALSLKDMSHVAALPLLARAGVASVKIEGRLRTPEYCAVAAYACRAALEGRSYDAALLQNVFSRSGFTDSYLESKLSGEMFGARTPADSAAGKAALPLARELFRREAQKVPVTFALTLSAEGAHLTVRDEAGCTAEARGTTPPQPAQKDPRPAYEAALQKTGGTPFLAQSVTLGAGTEGFVPAGEINSLRRAALDALIAARRHAEEARLATRLPARSPEEKELSEEILTALRNAFITFRQISMQLTSFRTAAPSVRNFAAQISAPSHSVADTRPATAAQFAAVAQMPAEAALCDALLLPLAEWRAVPPALRSKTWLTLPRAAFGTAEDAVQSAVSASLGAGFAGYFVQNIGQFYLCAQCAAAGGVPLPALWGGFGLNAADTGAALLYGALGARVLTLSCEGTLRAARGIVSELNDAALSFASEPTAAAHAATPLAVPATALLAYGHVPLMLTRACPLQTAHSCAGCPGGGTLRDRKGALCPVRCTAPGAAGVREIYNHVPLWLGDRRREIPAAWALLLFTTETPRRCAEVLHLWQTGARFDGVFTRGLYEKGLQL